MTSFAMIAGMMPMALGFGEGGEQTAPLGRAVVGGLAAATLATLFVLPLVFAIVQRRATTQIRLARSRRSKQFSIRETDRSCSRDTIRSTCIEAPVVFAMASLVIRSSVGCWRFHSGAAPVNVQTAQPKRGPIARRITLPAEIAPYQQATLYAKVAGYLKSISVDKGDIVKQGDLLAEIEVPELFADRAKFAAEVQVAEIDYKRSSKCAEESSGSGRPANRRRRQRRNSMWRVQIRSGMTPSEFHENYCSVFRSNYEAVGRSGSFYSRRYLGDRGPERCPFDCNGLRYCPCPGGDSRSRRSRLSTKVCL